MLCLFVRTLVIFLCVFFACSDDDDFSSDGSVSFSSDTINFDTTFTSIGSATKHFKVYNRGSNSFVIETIELMHPSESGFRMNIDGEKGTRLNNVTILKKDSLYGFIEVTVNPQNTGNPMLIRDYIKFLINGKAQYLQLQAVGQDVYIWKGETITKDTTLTADKPFLVYDSMVVKKDAVVTIEKGVKFFFKKDASMDIHGTLNAEGTAEEPIIFRSERFDRIEGNIPYDNVPGLWDGLYFYPESYNNRLENVFVRGATRGMTFYASDIQYKKAVLENTIIHNTSEYGVLATNCNIDAHNCLFTNSKGAALKLCGGAYSFLHCSIANYFAWSARKEGALVLANYSNIGKLAPLVKCDFINCIVYGSVPKEFLLDEVSNIAFEYRFVSCLLKGTESSDARFANVIWNKDPLFRDINEARIYSYNYRLKPASPAIDKADKSHSLSVPYDLSGRSRLDDANPDMGCYEWGN